MMKKRWKLLLARKGWKIEDALNRAKKIRGKEMTKAHLSYLLHSKNPQAKTISLLSEIFEVSVDEIFDIIIKK